MNAGWILPVALACCGADYAEQYLPEGAIAQAQFSQPIGQPAAVPSARIVAQQPTTQFGAQQNQPIAQQNSQAFPQGSSFAQQPRASVFSTQPTVNTSTQNWGSATSQPTGTVSDPRYASDPRYGTPPQTDPRFATAPQLSPPENSAAQQQFANQYNTAASQFNNNLRDAQQQAQQYGQQAQQLAAQAQQWQQQAQQYGQQAQQLAQQAQPYLSSLTNNPYAYVPAPPQADPSANQYLAGNASAADNQFGRSVLVSNQPNISSSFGQQSDTGQYGAGQYNNSQQFGTGGAQYTTAQQPQANTPTYDNRGQLYQPQLTSGQGQSAFTTSGQTNTVAAQDPRLMQSPTLNDPRYTQAQSPDTRPLTLDPPPGSALPNNTAGQVLTTGGTGQLSSPYANVQTPRADGLNTPQNSFGNNPIRPQNTTAFTSGSKTEVPSLFNNVLPTSNLRGGQPGTLAGGQFGASLNSAGNLGAGATNVELPWTPLVASLLCLFASVGANFYFGWNFTEYYFRYRKLLVEGEDDDRSRMREDDRRR